MREAFSPRRAAAGPTTLPTRAGAVGRRWGRRRDTLLFHPGRLSRRCFSARGSFAKAAGGAADNITRWEGGSWSAVLAWGMICGVGALAVSGSYLYAGGYFLTAGGSAANHIAKWDGSSWTALGSGMNDYVYALAVSGSDLYAGGGFTTAGGKVAERIGRWYLMPLSALALGIGRAN